MIGMNESLSYKAGRLIRIMGWRQVCPSNPREVRIFIARYNSISAINMGVISVTLKSVDISIIADMPARRAKASGCVSSF